jgi:hypothetical protein
MQVVVFSNVSEVTLVSMYRGSPCTGRQYLLLFHTGWTSIGIYFHTNKGQGKKHRAVN